MKKFKFSTREIGTVQVFDLEGNPTSDSVQEVAWKIQKNIRRHRLQRVILNFQGVASLDSLQMRKLLAACIRPQRSLIYGASDDIVHVLEDSYIPKNVRICATEKEVAEDLGPFLLEKGDDKKLAADNVKLPQDSIGYQMERRRSKRMHVAIPLDLKIFAEGVEPLVTHAIATNISEGGLFSEFLDLQVAADIDKLDPIKGLDVEIRIFPSANFPEKYHLMGRIIRKELRKKQLGLAVKFSDPHAID